MYRMRPRLRTHPKLSTKESPLPGGEWMEIVVSNEPFDFTQDEGCVMYMEEKVCLKSVILLRYV